jgi:hypothetical protein
VLNLGDNYLSGKVSSLIRFKLIYVKTPTKSNHLALATSKLLKVAVFCLLFVFLYKFLSINKQHYSPSLQKFVLYEGMII